MARRKLTESERVEAVALVRKHGILACVHDDQATVIFGSWIDFDATSRERRLIDAVFEQFPQDAYEAALAKSQEIDARRDNR